MTACSIDSCTRLARTRGWCGTHYQRWRRHGDPLHVEIQKRCTVGACRRPHHGRGYCITHYMRWRTKGDVGPVRIDTRFRPGVQRWPVAPVLDLFESIVELERLLGAAHRDRARWESALLTTAQADVVADALHLHPFEIWGDLWLAAA